LARTCRCISHECIENESICKFNADNANGYFKRKRSEAKASTPVL
jgi:hypothetical protein